MSQLFNTHVAKQSLLTAPAATDATTANGYNYVTGLPPILATEWAGVDIIAAVAEVVQIVTVGVTPPTIVPSTVYELRVGNPNKVHEGFAKRLTPVRYTSAATLSGSPEQDRQNVYRGLASAINNLQSKGGLDMIAYDLVDVAFGANTLVAGESVVGGTSGATGVVIAVGATLTIGMTSTTQFQNGETITAPSTNNATGITVTVGIGLHIEDTGSYYAPDPSENLGPSVVIATSGFTAADLTITQAGVISHGQGADLQRRTERINSTDNNLQSSSEYGFPNGFVAGEVYSLFLITVNKRLNVDAKTNSGGITTLRYAVWADENNGDLGGFTTAITGL